MIIKYIKTRGVKDPNRANTSDSGIDFFVPNDSDMIVAHPGSSVLIPLGIKCIIDEGYDMVFHNKSSVASKKGLLVGACVIDSGYRGELMLNLWNTSKEVQTINAGDKIVQGILRRVELYNPVCITEDQFNSYTSDRGEGGFGSTGNK